MISNKFISFTLSWNRTLLIIIIGLICVKLLLLLPLYRNNFILLYYCFIYLAQQMKILPYDIVNRDLFLTVL